MKNFRWTILAAALLASSPVVKAQSTSAPMSIPGAAGGGSSPSGNIGGTTASNSNVDPGTITNLGMDPSVQQTLPTQRTSGKGIAPDSQPESESSSPTSVSIMDEPSQVENGSLVNTGGEPIFMSMFGLTIALGAFLVRRRVSA